MFTIVYMYIELYTKGFDTVVEKLPGGGGVKSTSPYHLGTDHYFLSGGLPILGLADNFFQRIMRFKQFFSLHFVMKTIFFRNHFTKHYRLFYLK